MSHPEDRSRRLALELNPSLGIPIYRQVMDGLKRLVAGGVLAPGAQLPSIRELSAQLRINPSSAVKAYGELEHEGVITLDHGRGTFVAGDRAVTARSREAVLDAELDRLVGVVLAMGVGADDVLDRLRIRLRAGAAAKRGKKETR